MKVIDYRVVHGITIADLNREMREHLAAGWQPIGHAQPRSGDGWNQTVVKYAPVEEQDEPIVLELDHAQALASLLEPDALVMMRLEDVEVKSALHAIRHMLVKSNRLVG